METLTTNGIRISVETFYHPDYSQPTEGKVFFAYRITIQNLNDFKVKLLSRFWKITDADGQSRVVIGDGVIGKQPELEPKEMHAYVSGCPLTSGIGKMKGYYIMENLENQGRFQADVPEFRMVAPFKNN